MKIYGFDMSNPVNKVRYTARNANAVGNTVACRDDQIRSSRQRKVRDNAWHDGQ